MYSPSREDTLARYKRHYPELTQEKLNEFECCVRKDTFLKVVAPGILGSVIIHVLLPTKHGRVRPVISILTGLSIAMYQKVKQVKTCGNEILGPEFINRMGRRPEPPLTYNAERIEQQSYPSQDLPSSDYLMDDKPNWRNSGTGFENNTNVFDDTGDQFEKDATDKNMSTEKKRVTYDDLFQQHRFNPEVRREPPVRMQRWADPNKTLPPQQDKVFEDSNFSEEREYNWS